MLIPYTIGVNPALTSLNPQMVDFEKTGESVNHFTSWRDFFKAGMDAKVTSGLFLIGDTKQEFGPSELDLHVYWLLNKTMHVPSPRDIEAGKVRHWAELDVYIAIYIRSSLLPQAFLKFNLEDYNNEVTFEPYNWAVARDSSMAELNSYNQWTFKFGDSIFHSLNIDLEINKKPMSYFMLEMLRQFRHPEWYKMANELVCR